jgi:hypothetical protein
MFQSYIYIYIQLHIKKRGMSEGFWQEHSIKKKNVVYVLWFYLEKKEGGEEEAKGRSAT